jgi:hypothetical protein
VQATLSPRAVIIKPSKLATLARQLERRGYPQVSVTTPHQVGARNSFDQPTLAHLYISARLAHQRGETYRPPYSIILDLENQITPRDRARAEEILSESVRAIKKPAQARRQFAESEIYHPERSEAEAQEAEAQEHSTLALIQRALVRQTPLEIIYHSPYTDETTTRVIEPRRLEYRDEIPYLIAYCQRARAERTFRIARILAIDNQNDSHTISRRESEA